MGFKDTSCPLVLFLLIRVPLLFYFIIKLLPCCCKNTETATIIFFQRLSVLEVMNLHGQGIHFPSQNFSLNVNWLDLLHYWFLNNNLVMSYEFVLANRQV